MNWYIFHARWEEEGKDFANIMVLNALSSSAAKECALQIFKFDPVKTKMIAITMVETTAELAKHLQDVGYGDLVFVR